MQDVLREIRTDGAIVTEPTELQVCLAHKGFAWIEVETVGRAAHGSRFDLGIDANIRMGRVLYELEALEERVRTGRQHELVGPGSLHAGRIAGGTGPSIYAARCRLEIERRTIPGETSDDVLAEVTDILDRLRDADDSFEANARVTVARPPFEVPRDAPIVQSVASAFESITGGAPAFGGQTPWMDAAFLAEAGVATVVIGPAGAGAHADEEWVDVASVVTLAEVLVEAAKRYCR
jgi:acetylornithine deacetylase